MDKSVLNVSKEKPPIVNIKYTVIIVIGHESATDYRIYLAPCLSFDDFYIHSSYIIMRHSSALLSLLHLRS